MRRVRSNKQRDTITHDATGVLPTRFGTYEAFIAGHHVGTFPTVEQASAAVGAVQQQVELEWARQCAVLISSCLCAFTVALATPPVSKDQ